MLWVLRFAFVIQSEFEQATSEFSIKDFASKSAKS